MTTTKINYMAKYGHKLVDNGYSIIPITHAEKRPFLKNWTKLKDTTHQQVDAWAQQYPSAGIGVLTYNTPTIDLDILDSEFVERIVGYTARLLGQKFLLQRTGQAPKIAIPCHGTMKFGKLSSEVFIDGEGRRNQIEILANGQQFVVFGIHPKTQQPYSWSSMGTLLDTRREDLPPLDADTANKIIQAAVRHHPDDWYREGVDERGKLVFETSTPRTIECTDDAPVVEKTTCVIATKDVAELPAEPINATDQKLQAYQRKLSELPSDNYQQWVSVGMALHKESGGSDDGFKVWDVWSRKSNKYKIEEMQKKWASFKNDNAEKSINGGYINKLYSQFCQAATPHVADTDTQPKPVGLSEASHKVMPFDADVMLPQSMAMLVKDAAYRMSCSPDFIGVSMIPVLASIIGSQVAVQPKKHDRSYRIYPTAWAMIVAHPSVLKSPAMQLVLNPLEQAQKALEDGFKEDAAIFEAEITLYVDQEKDKKKKLGKHLEAGDTEIVRRNIKEMLDKRPQKPVERHLIANDVTVEKFQVMMAENFENAPYSGTLFYRDELSAHLETLDREDKINDRGFFMQCFNGYGIYRVNRMSRDKVVVENTNASVLGAIQPAKIMRQVKKCVDGSNNDGLFQRFQFGVIPIEMPRKWVDVPVDEAALIAYENMLAKLMAMQFVQDGKPAIFKFAPEAQTLFEAFYAEMCLDISDKSNHLAVRAHYGKMDKTISTLALVFELATNPSTHNNTISEQSMAMAYRWYAYLKSHAEAIYSTASQPDMEGAKLILARKDKLPEVFTMRDIKQNGWVGLKTTEDVEQALQILEDSSHLVSAPCPPKNKGGRPTTRFKWVNV